RLTKLETHQGFAAELAAAGTISLASSLGIPLSTTHTLSTAIVGVGVVHGGVRAVNWRVARDLLTAWVLTFPICGAISWAILQAVRHLPTAIQVGILVALVFMAVALTWRRPRLPRRRREA
ncbi:MAG: hypothetical protein K0S65_2097, partial [Labilithrix sp.]|nr:hypothetical protein [Labilithrix sp.]